MLFLSWGEASRIEANYYGQEKRVCSFFVCKIDDRTRVNASKVLALLLFENTYMTSAFPVVIS
jgi:hypothetical protein